MKRFTLCIVCCLILLSCITDPNTNNEEFSFKINVKDLAGNPVEGLNIVLINKFNNPWGEFEWPLRACTTIPFRLEKASFVELNIGDIERNIIRSLISEELPACYHSVVWNGKDDEDNSVNSGVYYCSMNASENDTLYYQGEIMMYLLSFSNNHKNGSTNAEGLFISQNKKPFVNFYDLDSLQIVDENGEILGLEAFSDTTVICLFDENSSDIHQFEYVIVEDENNEFNIIWDPETSWKNKGKSKVTNKDSNGVIPPIETKLKQNFPNPFN
ncbi:MAG: hypothetical protein K8R49_07610 [Candidatus Cloacimonetes bacterium]|nr:hypothetical protein [Candidatus Cloacimonadota bacterium]